MRAKTRARERERAKMRAFALHRETRARESRIETKELERREGFVRIRLKRGSSFIRGDDYEGQNFKPTPPN